MVVTLIYYSSKERILSIRRNLPRTPPFRLTWVYEARTNKLSTIFGQLSVNKEEVKVFTWTFLNVYLDVSKQYVFVHELK